MTILVRHMLSKSLYKLFKEGEFRFLIQVPFVNKEGIPLFDEEVDYVNIVDATKELLEAGASPLYYVTDIESFLLPSIIQYVESGSGFSDDVKTKVVALLIENISEKELSGLLPVHGNLLFKQMLNYENELNTLTSKGLQFKQNTENRHGEKPIEIKALWNGDYTFFTKLAQNSTKLDFDLIYVDYKETTLRKEIVKINEKINSFDISSVEDFADFEKEKNDNRKKTVELLEKWMLKNKIEQKSQNITTTKNTRLKI